MRKKVENNENFVLCPKNGTTKDDDDVADENNGQTYTHTYRKCVRKQ